MRSAGWKVPVPILMYHYIRPSPGPSDPVGEDLSVSPRMFAAQMQYLASHGYHPITLAQLALARAHRFALPPRPIVLSFDDGYRDFYTTAWPILRRHHFASVLFVITSRVGWPLYVTWEQLEWMERSGLVEVGDHTVHHDDLPSLTYSEARAEILDARRAIEQHLRHPAVSFSYPGGRYDSQDVQILRGAGFRVAVTTIYGYAEPTDDPLLLPRVRIHGSTSLDGFAWLVSHG